VVPLVVVGVLVDTLPEPVYESPAVFSENVVVATFGWFTR
jgi:hypothetical protein